MKKNFIFLMLSLLIHSVEAQTSEPSLSDILELINKDSLERTVQDLQNFETRLCSQTIGHNRKVAQYLVDRMRMYGIDNARIDSFFFSGSHWILGDFDQYMYNVIGTIKGTGATDSTVIIGAHLDAISFEGYYQPTSTSPGADDNATGCAVMIEMIRIIQQNDLSPYHNIDFMGYDCEEFGLFGAHYDAEKRREANEKIIVMLNNDMVGNQPDDLPWEVTLHWYDNSLDVTEKACQAAINYTIVSPYVPSQEENEPNTRSDSYAYYLNDFKAIFTIEKNFTSFYHSENDLISNLNFEYNRQIARLNFVLLADYSGMNLKTTNPQDLLEKGYDQLIELYPNPVSDWIKIHRPNHVQIHRIDVMDITGRWMESLSGQVQVIGLNKYGNGVYFFAFHTDKGVICKKVVKR